MNVRKRGLALLMCICMIFTLLPFSVFAENAENGNRGGTESTAQQSVVYGTYDEDGVNWTPDSTITDPTQTYKNVTYSKTAAPVQGADNTYDITLNVSTTVKKSAVVLVLDTSKSSLDCANCGQTPAKDHKGDCEFKSDPDFKASEITDAQSFLAAEKASATEFIKNYAGSIAGMGKYIQIVSYKGTANKELTEWVDVSTADGMNKVVAAINGLTSETANKDKNLEQGLAKAYECVTSAPDGVANKYVIAVTNSWFNKAGADGNGDLTWDAYDTANKLKDNNCAVYTVYSRNHESPRDSSNGMIYTYLEEKVASPDCAYANADTGVLYKASWLKNTIGTTILESMKLDTVPTFTVTDPMGEYIELVSTSLTDTSAQYGSVKKTITWTPTVVSSTDGDTISFTLKYTVKLNTGADGFEYGEWYPTNRDTLIKFNDGDAETTKHFIVPGVKAAVYDVTYKYVDEDFNVINDSALKAPVDPKSYAVGAEFSVVAAPAKTDIPGYDFVDWYLDEDIAVKTGAVLDMVKGGMTIYGKLTRSETIYIVNYIWNGEYIADSNTFDCKVGDVIKYGGVATDNSVKPVEIEGYTAKPVALSELKISETATQNVINFYYYKNVEITAKSDSVVYDGKEHSVSGFTGAPKDADFSAITVGAQGTNAGTYDAVFDEETVGTVDATEKYIVVKADNGKLEIAHKKVTVTAEDKSKYVGEKDPDFTAKVVGLVNDENESLIDYTITRDPGEKAGTYKIIPVGAKEQGNYEVTFKNGTLTIKRHYTPNPPIMDEITVEITGNSDSVVYDGTEHSVKDYTVKISDPRYTEADFTFTGKAEASGINAGTYEMGLKAEQFKNTNARFTNVKFVIKADGVLTITPKDLTITAGSKTEYGPTPVTCGDWTVSGLAAGDKVESVKITGIQSVPGSSPNVPSDAVIKNAKGEDVTKNYAIKYVNGTLTMLEVLNKEDHFNYIIGTPEGLSLPTANVTRAEVATIFFRLMTDDARAKFDSLDNNFSDVAKGQWYNRAISTLANAGIIKGDPAGTYRPGDAITRAEMAAIIARFGDFKEGGKTFNDISGHWAQKYIELAASNGWINGNPDGTFKPNNNITRAETVAMINRVLDRQTKDVSDLLPVSQMTNWSDNANTAAWYYRDMQEATNNHKAERVGNSIYEKWTEKLPDIDWASYQI